MNLIEIRNKIKNVESILQVFNAMKLMASSKYQAYVKKLSALKKVHENIHLALTKPMKMTSDIYLILGSDKGLCGSFNAKIRQRAKEIPDESRVILVGKKLIPLIKQKRFEVVSIISDADGEDLYSIASLLTEQLSLLPPSSIELVYTRYINGVSQEAVKENLLKGIKLTRDKIRSEGQTRELSFYLFLFARIYRALVESKTCEHFSRMQAMENSVKNTRELKERLQVEYNKRRQAAITQEILEIVNGSMENASGA